MRMRALLFLYATLLVIALASSSSAAASPAFGAAPLSATPSTTNPYLACSPAPGRFSCDAVVVPSGAQLRKLNATPAGGSGVGGSLAPADLRSAYRLPSTTNGAGQTVAIVDAFDDPAAEADLAAYRSQYGLSSCTTANGCFRKVNQTGGTSYPGFDAGWALEISLDVDMVSASCPNCHILLVETNDNSFANLTTGVNEAAALGATEISNSYGAPEFGGETSFDAAYSHRGIPITVSTGDAGYNNHQGGANAPSYPASSPSVIAVGGTSLQAAANGRGWTETAWSGAGSGCSGFEPKPSWQHDSGCTTRTTSDVSAVADPATPVSVYDSTSAGGPWVLVGGTSAASPLVAGVEALSSDTVRSLGAKAYYQNPSALFDVTSGTNGTCSVTYLCSAGAGYDGPTGLGTPNGVVAQATFPSVFFADGANGTTVSDWTVSTLGWEQGTFGGDAVAAGTSPTAVAVNGVPRVFFVDATKGNTLAEWSWSLAAGWHLTPLLGHPVAAGTSPSAAVAPGASEPDVFFVDATDNNTITRWSWSTSSGWQQTFLLGHPAAAGTSPSAVAVTGNPVAEAFFVDATNADTITEWSWSTSSGWQQGFLFGHPAAAGTSPSAVAMPGSSTPDVFFVDATNNNTITEWAVSSGWQQGFLFGHPAAAGTSPTAVAATPLG